MAKHLANTKKPSIASRRAYRPQILIAIVALLALSGVYLVYKSFAASGSMSVLPATSNVSLGTTLSVTVRENSSTDGVNAVESDLTYDQTKLQFVSIDTSTSAFGLQAVGTGGNGAVSISRANTTNLTGDQLIAVVNFTAIGSGSTSVSIAGTSAVVRGSDVTNILVVKNNGTYTISDTTAPTTPSGLTSPSKTVNSVNLSWTASTDNVAVTGYKIYRGGTQIGTSTGTTYTDSGLAANTAYSYTVAAYDAAGNTSAQTSALAVTTLADTTAPSVPSGLTSPTKTISSINLSWTASTDNIAVAGYKIYRGGTQIGTSATTTYSDTGLTPNTAYSYTVAAYDAAGNTSAQSSALAVSTLADTTAPSVPTGLNSPSKTVSSVSLSWTASTDNVAVTGYKVYRGGTQIATSATTTYTNSGLTQGTAYSYTVAAYDAAGNTSAQTSALAVTTSIKTGDINGDSKIDALDLAILAINFGKSGQTFAQGDLNGDGVVNIYDLSILATYWGT